MPFDRTPRGLVPRKRTPKQVLAEIKAKKVKFIDLQFMDVPGRTQHVSITSTMLEEDTFKEGVAKLDGSSIKGFAEIYESDMLLLPDPSSYALIPWGDARFPTGRLICDIQWGFGKGRFSRDPRYIAQKAEERMKAAGFTDSFWGPEIEFFVFDSVTWDVHNPFSTGYKINSVESAVESRGTNFPIRWKEGYYPVPPQDTLQDYRSEVAYLLEEGMAVMDPDTLAPVPADGETMGEIMFRGNITMKGYLKNKKATDEAFRGGWFHSGDLAVMQSDGYVKIRDRSKDIIISGGENISSLEVEDVLYRHPAVLAAAVVAKPDARWGETPCAFVELKANATVTEAELIEFCRGQLARFKAPRAIVFGELPKTSTGKIQKFVLRDKAKSTTAIE